MEKLPWLEYTGQATPELVACKSTHQIASLLCAFEWGIQAKIGPGGEGELTGVERLLLAVMALQREVNNGGYSQFFTNSSRRFASTIVEYLHRIGCDITATLTERAIRALTADALSDDSVSHAALNANTSTNQVLDMLDREYYKLNEIEPHLFEFIETHQNNIQLTKGAKPPFDLKRPNRSNAAKLCTYVAFAKPPGETVQELREPAREIAKRKSIAVTDEEIDAALTLYLFGRSLRADDTPACEVLAHQAFQLMREDTTHCILHKEWVLRLIRETKLDFADASTLYYLEYLDTCDRTSRKTQNTMRFWAAILQDNRAILPKSVAFFQKAFPELDLDEPIATARRNQVSSPRISSKPN
jgi:hypothetical protein